jgi:hypothetical protein
MGQRSTPVWCREHAKAHRTNEFGRNQARAATPPAPPFAKSAAMTSLRIAKARRRTRPSPAPARRVRTPGSPSKPKTAARTSPTRPGTPVATERRKAPMARSFELSSLRAKPLPQPSEAPEQASAVVPASFVAVAGTLGVGTRLLGVRRFEHAGETIVRPVVGRATKIDRAVRRARKAATAGVVRPREQAVTIREMLVAADFATDGVRAGVRRSGTAASAASAAPAT